MDFNKTSEIDNKKCTDTNKVFSDAFVDKFIEDVVNQQDVNKMSEDIVDNFIDKGTEPQDIKLSESFVDRLDDGDITSLILGLLSKTDFDGINSSWGFNLTNDEIVTSVKQASNFFHLNSPRDIQEDWTTGVICGMKNSTNDDILVFNKQQMKEMNITDKESFDLVMTHEGGHRALQSLPGRYSIQEEELCCDFLAGVRAGLNGLNEDKLVKSLQDTIESKTHPDGLLRSDSIKSGVLFAKEYKAINGEAPSFHDCLKIFDQKMSELSGKLEDIAVVNLKAESGTDDLKALFVDNKNYHLKEAQNAKETEVWHCKQASEALAKGDISSAKDHSKSADLYERDAKEHLESASKCKK